VGSKSLHCKTSLTSFPAGDGKIGKLFLLSIIKGTGTPTTPVTSHLQSIALAIQLCQLRGMGVGEENLYSIGRRFVLAVLAGIACMLEYTCIVRIEAKVLLPEANLRLPLPIYMHTQNRNREKSSGQASQFNI
jgi:hypothetical protein